MAWIAPVIAAAGQIGGGLISSSGQSSANRQNLRIAREQMAFQERMSNTAYRRSATDLEGAGLNRILALSSPASTPQGAKATMLNAKAAIGQGVSSAVGSAIGVQQATAQIKNTEAQTKNTEANTKNAETQNLIMQHGEAVASVAADIVRTVRELIGNKTPAQISQLIKDTIAKATAALSDAMTSSSQAPKRVSENFNKLKESVSIYVNDMLAQPNPAHTAPTQFSRQLKTHRVWADTKLRGRNFSDWEKTPAGKASLKRYAEYIKRNRP